MPIYQGKFTPKNSDKYNGDPTTIYFRSGWELSVMMWCDEKSDIISWSSERMVVPYISPLDNRYHRYFVDFTIKFKDGKTYAVEIKPKRYTKPPKKPKYTTRKYIKEVFEYGKNMAKWKAAKEFCEERGYTFQVWTEDTLKKLGVKINA